VTTEEVESFQLNPEFLRYLDAFRSQHGLEKSAMRVLDFGCGRGMATIALRRLGYDAVGVDINAVTVQAGHTSDSAGVGGQEHPQGH